MDAQPTVTSHFDFSDNSKPGGPRQWWPDPKGEKPETLGAEVGQSMVDTARAIETSTQEQERQDLNLLYGSMYEGRTLNSLYQYGGRAAQSLDGVPMLGAGEITWNVIRSVVQTVASQVSPSAGARAPSTRSGTPSTGRTSSGFTASRARRAGHGSTSRQRTLARAERA